MIYLDHAATTKTDEKVLSAMMPYLTDVFGNASAQYEAGRRAAGAVSAARDEIASLLGVGSEEIYFTSGGTEADNWALRGIYSATRGHIVLSAIEHPALLSCAEDLVKEGADVTLVSPDADGRVSADAVRKAMRDDTAFVGVMAANNETGVVQPVSEIAAMCGERGVFFFSDCVQAVGVLPVNRGTADGFSFSAHKIYGPKGVGVLRIKKGVRINRFVAGGRQERNQRGGTTNVAGIVGCAKALEIAEKNREKNNAEIAALRDAFVEGLLAKIPGTHLNGDRKGRLPSNANIRFDGVSGEQILMLLDARGVAVSTGSACAAGAVEPSHVLMAMGLSETEAKSSVRFSFGRENTREDVEKVLSYLTEIVSSLRAGR
ncbi:MAG: cysteine desulfurase [Clostridia bacterium]|nr:cysteine desulfurase [Clostridia bacterium]